METLLCSSGYGLKKEKFVLLLTIISDRFHWTACHCFFAQSLFFFRLRLLEHKRVVVLVGANEIRRRRIATNIAVDTGRVYVIFAGNIFFYAIVSVRHKAEIRSQRSEVRGQKPAVPSLNLDTEF
jgi:hypothetical protein